jgi:hypothetical protein
VEVDHDVLHLAAHLRHLGHRGAGEGSEDAQRKQIAIFMMRITFLNRRRLASRGRVETVEAGRTVKDA